MKLEDMTQEKMDQAKACRTKDEILAFIRDNRIELSPEQMEQISGGYGDRETNTSRPRVIECHQSPSGYHAWEFTGITRPGTILGSLWPDYKHRCKYCTAVDWKWFV